MDRVWHCTGCELPVRGNEEKFFPDVTRTGGVSSMCRNCLNAYYRKKRGEENERLRSEGLAGQMILAAKRLKADANKQGIECTVQAHELMILHERYKGVCCGCGSGQNVQWQPIVPIAVVGCLSWLNLQMVCRKCLSAKGCFGIDFTVRPPVIRHNPLGAVMQRKR